MLSFVAGLLFYKLQININGIFMLWLRGYLRTSMSDIRCNYFYLGVRETVSFMGHHKFNVCQLSSEGKGG